MAERKERKKHLEIYHTVPRYLAPRKLKEQNDSVDVMKERKRKNKTPKPKRVLIKRVKAERGKGN